jgi:hypothetical protein
MSEESKTESEASPISRHDLKEEASVIEYVNAAASSSNRARAVMIVLIVSTVLVAAELRLTTHSWLDARIDIRTAALKFADKDFDPAKSDLLAAIDPNKEKSQEERQRAMATQRARYEDAKLFLRDQNLDPKNPDDKALLMNDLENYRKLRVEQVRLIHIPFFAAALDQNDIGPFAGLTFVVVLLWLRFSKARELANLKLLFSGRLAFSKENLKRCYELLAMQQVFTVPIIPSLPVKTRWRVIPKMLYFLPLPVYILQMYFDFTTVFDLSYYGIGKAYFLVATSSLFLLIICVLILRCLFLSNEIDEEWDEVAPQVYSPEELSTTRKTEATTEA